MTLRELSYKYLELFKEMITKKAKSGDNFMLELRGTGLKSISWIEINILYSRYYSGGSYNSLCSINFHDNLVEVYQYSKYNIEATESSYIESFDLAAPDCFDKIVDKIIASTCTMQLDRRRSLFPINKLEPPNVWERKNT